jgi:hypothetical protein
MFERLSDEELVRRTLKARLDAHKAPGGPSDAWARHAKEWMLFAKEIDRRGLKQPGLPANH